MKPRNTDIEKVEQHANHRQSANGNGSEVVTVQVLPNVNEGEPKDELTKLGEDFRHCHAALKENTSRLMAVFKQTASEAVACGEILIKAKKLAGHGAWLKWLAEHCKISESTAGRYMKLARKCVTVTNLTTKTLTECYRDLGMLKDSKSKTKSHQPPTDEPSEFLKAKKLILDLMELATTTSDPERMSQELAPIIAWHQEHLEAKQKQQDAAAREQEFSTTS